MTTIIGPELFEVLITVNWISTGPRGGPVKCPGRFVPMISIAGPTTVNHSTHCVI